MLLLLVEITSLPLKCVLEGGDVVQGGRGEARDGISPGLPEETHGAEGVPAEE